MNSDNGMGALIKGLFFLAVIVLVLYVLFILLLTAAYVAALCFAGRRLRRQTTNQYQLTWKSGLALLVLAIVTFFAAQALLGSSGEAAVLAWPLAVLLFVLEAILLIDLWALAKRWSHMARIAQKRGEEQQLASQLQRIEQAITNLDATRGNLESRYGSLWTQQAELEELINQLQLRDPRVWGVAVDRWRSEYAPLNDEELRVLEEQLAGALAGQPPPQRALQAAIVRMLRLMRRTGQPQTTRSQQERDLEALVGERETLRRRQSEAEAERLQAQAAHQALTAGRIVLD